MENLKDIRIGQQIVKRLEIDPWREGINAIGFLRACHLDKAKLCPVGGFPHEFGIDRDELGLAQPVTKCAERGCVCN